MMKILTYTTILISFFLNISCSGQSVDKNSFKGNWQIQKHDKYETIYQEMYINDSSMYFYDTNLGLMPTGKYYFKNNVLMHSQLGSDFEELGVVSFVNEEKMVFENKGVSIVYKRLHAENLLGDLILMKIDNDNYSISFFDRYRKWNETKVTD